MPTQKFEIEPNEDLPTTLSWKGGFFSEASGRWKDQTWTFMRRGILSRKISVRSDGDEIAVFRYESSASGRLTFKDDRVFKWKRPGFFRIKWCFTNRGGDPLLCFEFDKQRRFGIRPKLKVNLSESIKSVPELPLLELLGEYLIQSPKGTPVASVSSTAVILYIFASPHFHTLVELISKFFDKIHH